MLRVELHHLFVEPLRIIGILGLNLLQHGGNHLHISHRLLLLKRQRQQKQTNHDGEKDDC